MTSFNDDSYPEWAQASSLTREYYEFEWGRRLTEEHELYELIALLGFQAGLNWSMVLNKRERLREVFHNFDPDAVAQFDHDDIEGMLHDKTLIRNRRKLSAAVHNAKAIVMLRKHGGISALVWARHFSSSRALLCAILRSTRFLQARFTHFVASGVTLAGIILTLGFAVGPIATSLIGASTANIALLFAVSVALSAIAVVAGLVLGDAPRVPIHGSSENSPAQDRSLGKALAVSLPMALWVFSCITTSVVILSARAAGHIDIPILLPALSSGLAFGSGLIMQYLGRKFSWGRKSGTAGAISAALGFAVAAFGGNDLTVTQFILAALLLGSAYGLCLREGLVGINTYVPLAKHGTGIGIYYVFTYFGFAFPFIFELLDPLVGVSAPLVFIALLAVGSAALRAVQIRRGYLV